MSRRSTAKKKEAKVRSVSGAKGGASTGRGMNYQIDFAIQQTLDYISRALCAPHRVWEVRIEPRVSSSDGLTSWDIGFDPDNTLFEIKLKPTREDIEEWVGRVATDGGLNPRREFHLVYSKGAGRHLDSLERLIRIAREANADSHEFNSKVKAEGVSNDDQYLAALGDKAYDLFGRMNLEQVPEYLLKSNIQFRARQLAAEAGGRRLREYLSTKFHEAVPHRSSFSVVDLIDEARKLGVQFQPPAAVDTSDISPTASAALIILQTCTDGIPTEVIGAALNCSEIDIESELQELQNSHVVALDESLWSMKPLPTVLTAANAQDILARCLSSLLTFIESSPANTNIQAHVGNVIALAKECRSSHPTLVASVFTKLDKRLKRIGNKRLVWFVAHLSIKAARTIRNPDREVVEAEARSLICGTSWAFQRLHKVAKARVDADDSYALAQNMRLDRTLAFCVKCCGRLCRMEAEAMSSGEQKTSKLLESVALLREAIEKFGQLAEFGPTDPEVGDCYSLLGRTYLELRDLPMAQDTIKKAYELIVDETSKDYIDLVILNGDFEVASGDRRAASHSYDRALQISIGSDPEVSEMRARAHFQRGSNEEARGNRVAAQADYESAMKIWRSLQDDEFAAKAAWKNTCLGDSLSGQTLTFLEREAEDIKVRVETVTMHHESLQQSGNAAIARRSEPPAGYWRQLIRRAKERIASKGQRSETEW